MSIIFFITDDIYYHKKKCVKRKQEKSQNNEKFTVLRARCIWKTKHFFQPTPICNIVLHISFFRAAKVKNKRNEKINYV